MTSATLMAWKGAFQKGVSCFKLSEYQNALTYFNEAIALGCDQFTVYDCRAAVYEQLGNHRESLQDSKKVIDLAPERWQGYARSARLFHELKKHDAAVKMVDFALDRVKSDDARRRGELVALRHRAVEAQVVVAQRRREYLSKTAYHFGKLPVEIFGLIFASVTELDPAFSVNLSRVCRQWRAVTLNTPSLWRTLVLSNKHPTRKAQTWIKRSRASISTLLIRESMSFPDSMQVLDELETLSWESLRACCLQGHVLDQFHRRLIKLGKVQVLSSVEELEVQDGNYLDWFLIHVTDARLQSLTLTGSNSFGLAPWDNIHRLKSLVIRGARVAASVSIEVLAAIEANPMLETLSIDCRIFNDMAQPSSPITMAHLKHLELQNVNCFRPIIDNVHAPSLRTLRLFNDAAMDEVLAQYTRQGLPCLNELRIGKCQLSATSLIQLLQVTPALQVLEISSIYGAASAILEELSRVVSSDQAHPTSNAVICPFLKDVDLSHCSDLLTGPVIRFIKSRLAAECTEDTSTDVKIDSLVSQIDSIKLDGCINIEAGCLPWLRSKVRLVSCVFMSKKESRRR